MVMVDDKDVFSRPKNVRNSFFLEIALTVRGRVPLKLHRPFLDLQQSEGELRRPEVGNLNLCVRHDAAML
jgi:hypothetical protein